MSCSEPDEVTDQRITELEEELARQKELYRELKNRVDRIDGRCDELDRDKEDTGHTHQEYEVYR